MCSRHGLEATKGRAEAAGERVSRKVLWAAALGAADRDLGGGADGRGGGWAGEEQRQGLGRAGARYPDPPRKGLRRAGGRWRALQYPALCRDRIHSQTSGRNVPAPQREGCRETAPGQALPRRAVTSGLGQLSSSRWRAWKSPPHPHNRTKPKRLEINGSLTHQRSEAPGTTPQTQISIRTSAESQPRELPRGGAPGA